MPQDEKRKDPGGKGQKGVSTTIYLDKQVKELVEGDAEEQERSTSFIINSILKKHYGVVAGKKKK
ncbi:MAG: hypothetical protein J5I98_14340 [Phaeodactylibacter sp.]|nr:hypothetical protein [Phaeodactylibacter sp.]